MKSQDWFAVRGDETLALDWPGVDENSVVWEIGGYEGRWALQMAEKYNPQLYVFEPQEWAADKIREKLAGYKASVHQFGLWIHDGKMQINDYGRDGASFVKLGEPDPHTVLTANVYSFFIKKRINQIDVCLMNIEGGEFVLLPYMISKGMMKHIKYFWCQWHLFVPNATEKWLQLRQMLEQTHEMIWDCGVTAQAWKRREKK